MRGLLPAAVVLYGVVVPCAFAVGRRNVDPETNMNIVSCGAGRGNAAGAGRFVARGRTGPAALLGLQPLYGGGASSEVCCAVWFRDGGTGYCQPRCPASLLRILLRPLMPAVDLSLTSELAVCFARKERVL